MNSPRRLYLSGAPNSPTIYNPIKDAWTLLFRFPRDRDCPIETAPPTLAVTAEGTTKKVVSHAPRREVSTPSPISLLALARSIDGSHGQLVVHITSLAPLSTKILALSHSCCSNLVLLLFWSAAPDVIIRSQMRHMRASTGVAGWPKVFHCSH